VSTKRKVDRAPLRAYWQVWLRLTALQFEVQLANARAAAIFFILGKLLRLLFAFLFLYIIVSRTQALAGYNLQEAVFILALFNLSTTLNQLFLRGVYVFRSKVVDGSFDFYLLNPLSELFYSLFSLTDVMDLLLVIPYSGIVIWAWSYAGYAFSISGFLYLALTLLIMFTFAFAFHVVVISIGVKFLEVDNTIMLYRDLEKMAAFPIEIYGKYLSMFLTYVVPFALMATIPARLIFGLSSPLVLLFFFPLSLLLARLALWLWHASLRSYSSASS
jgi:ABC-2 type transport system permease protein